MKNLNDNSFGDFLSEGTCLVQFSATWCAPCKVLTKTLASADSFPVPIGKIDIDQSPEIARSFGIRSVPTMIVFKEGKEVGRKMGTRPLAQVEEFLNESIG